MPVGRQTAGPMWRNQRHTISRFAVARTWLASPAPRRWNTHAISETDQVRSKSSAHRWCASRDVRQPTAPELRVRDAREVRLDIENRRAIEHVDAADEQPRTFTAQQCNDRQPDWIRPLRRPGGEHAVRT